MEVICYACGRGEYPENTMEAIAHCQMVNQDWRVEIDLQMTKDGEIILFHDDNLKRITDLNMAVCDVPLSYVQQLNAGYSFRSNQKYPYRNNPIRIPTLAAVFERFSDMKFLLDVHVSNLKVVDKIIAIIEQKRMKNNLVIVSKFDNVVRDFRSKKNDWIFGAPTKEVKRMVFSSFFNLDGLFPLQSDILMIPTTFGRRKLLTQRVLDHVGKRNKKIWVWLHEGREVITVNSKNQYLRLMDLGIEGVFTEFPEKLYKALNTDQI